MNYNNLRYFSVLAQLEHYTLAAARLEISQPSLSSAIHNLETELGVQLFEKAGRNVRLTEQGRYFRKKVDAALSELNEATQTLMASREQAPVVVRMGLVSGTLHGPLAELIRDYLAQNPRAKLQLTEGSAEELLEMMHREKLDLALVDSSVRDRSLHFRKLFQRDLLAAVPSGHPLARQERLNPRQLEQVSRITFHHGLEHSFEEWAAGLGSSEDVVCQVNTVDAALELTAAGVGVAVIPADCAKKKPGVVYVPMENWHQALYVCIFYDKWLDPPVWDFVETVVRTLRRSTK